MVFLTVAGPDNGGNYSLGTTVEGVRAAIDSARASKGLVIAERNANMSFVLGTTVHQSEIDYLIETNYDSSAHSGPYYGRPCNKNRQPDRRTLH